MMSPDPETGSRPYSPRRIWAASLGFTSMAVAAVLGFAFLSTDDCTTVTVTSVDGSQTISRTCT